jgi:hypothetical protein
MPPANATTLDAVEQDIAQRLEAEWAWQGDELLTQLRAYAHRLNGCSVDVRRSFIREGDLELVP